MREEETLQFGQTRRGEKEDGMNALAARIPAMLFRIFPVTSGVEPRFVALRHPPEAGHPRTPPRLGLEVTAVD